MLELFHPDGQSKRTLVFGAGEPQWPGRALWSPPSDGQADLIVLAPSSVQASSKTWMSEAVDGVGMYLAPDGLACVLAAPWPRRLLRLRLRGLGLREVCSLLHVPDWAESRYVVPLGRHAAAYAFAELLPTRAWKRGVGRFAAALPGSWRPARDVLRSVSVLFQWPAARPTFEWLFRLVGNAPPGPVVVGTSWRGCDGGLGIVLHGLAAGASRPHIVAKLSTEVRLATNGEIHALKTVAPGAARAGVTVPRFLSDAQVGGRHVLLETFVDGRPAAALLAHRPDQLSVVLGRVTPWLERWNTATARSVQFDRARMDSELLGPATQLAPQFEEGSAYAAWLTQRCAAFEGTSVPLVACHNDLTMWNVLLEARPRTPLEASGRASRPSVERSSAASDPDTGFSAELLDARGRGRLGIVDWERASEDGLPLVDLFFALADAVLAVRGGTWLSAVRACFEPSGLYARPVSQYVEQLARSLSVSSEVATLALHACWLQHALREQTLSGGAPGARPFLEVVAWLAHRRHTIC